MAYRLPIRLEWATHDASNPPISGLHSAKLTCVSDRLPVPRKDPHTCTTLGRNTEPGEEVVGQPARRTARRRRLGAELKALREAAKVTSEEAARAIHGDRTKISRQETGRHRVLRLELDVLLDLYQVGDEKLREWLIALASEGGKRSWWRQHSDKIPPGFKELLTLESDAERIAVFQSQLIPGLLQTRDYATAIINGHSAHLADDKREFYVNLRMERQEIFQRAVPPQYLAIIQEGALRQEIGGPKVLTEQLRHLVALSRAPEMTIQVIPLLSGRLHRHARLLRSLFLPGSVGLGRCPGRIPRRRPVPGGG
ncbi:helix-turn-helix domain-containing protein [Streptomyces hesseae]|uniref:Helix-turn-helix transcriptional regulator n=1 Tax=Streptomyces hesseae TaxID=3075519 RepID=A0ABU2SPR1_9ACTN|nr:helix-turn-helix transcriptional regulator [Streptomyces sp. DSM 40473]MDT0450986.1 helix-turn-helix transcriptional regulator [Streptomyces sp. DSM 40473]